MSDDYLWDRSGPPDPEVARLERLLAPLAHDAPLRMRRRPPWLAIGVVAVAAAAGVALWVALRSKPAEPIACSGDVGFRFVGHGGAVACGDRLVAAGVLPIGGVLDTGAHEADLTIADIGTAQLGRDTRVSLERSGEIKHRLALEHGHLHARVAAPPRLFEVSTRSTDVIDLGCEYTIDVDATGAGAIHVELGQVELATSSKLVVVAPAATHARILPGRRPGLPIVDGASSAFEAAVTRYLDGDTSAVDALVATATRLDAITLVNLAMIDTAHRRPVLARLAELSPPPGGYTIDDALDPKILDLWRDDIVIRQRAAHEGGKPAKSR